MSSSADVVDAVATAAASVPGVTGLNSGRFGEVATYLPGRRVVGIKLHDTSGEVHIEVDLSRSITETAEAVRAAVEAAAGRPMTVVVEDVSVVEPEDTPTPEVGASDTV